MESKNLRFTPKGSRKDEVNGIFPKALGHLERLLRFTGLFDLGVSNALDIRLNTYEFFASSLPKEIDGYRILHLSDLHLDMLAGLDEAIASVVKGIDADLCVLTGDYRADTMGPHNHVVSSLERIVSHVRSRDGIYLTLGNHDDHRMVESIEKLGLRVLVNESVEIKRDSSILSLIGLDDAHSYYTPAAEVALCDAVSEFSIVISHSPDLAEAAARAGHQVYLCGHTHGGQICLPGGVPIITHCEAARKLARGKWRVGDMYGLTNVGCGVSGLPVRFFSRAEIALVTLRSNE